MNRDISNMADVIDSRDIIERIEELEELETALKDAQEELEQLDGDDEDRAEAEGAVIEAETNFTSEEREELRILRELAEQCEGYAADWQYGETLIRDSYFQTYAQELADDIGAIPKGRSWPMTCIDWEQAARELQQDYTEVDYDGVSYWIR